MNFTALWDFHWIRIASPSPGNWLTVRSWMLMKFFSFDENWSLVIWRFCVEFIFIVFMHRSRRWRPLFELVRNRISSIWLLFPEESFGYDWMKFVSFHNLMTWPHLLVEVISWVLVSVLYGGLRTCSVVSPFETSFSKSPCRRGLLGLLLFTPLWQSFA
jgi:hypothetical protein